MLIRLRTLKFHFIESINGIKNLIIHRILSIIFESLRTLQILF